MTGAVRGVVWILFKGGGVVCVGGDREQSQAKGWYMNNFTFCFFSPPSPSLHYPSSPTRPSTPPRPPSTSRLFNTFQISACCRLPSRVASLLMEFGGVGCGSGPGLLTHTQPNVSERLPSVNPERKLQKVKGAGSTGGKRHRTASEVSERLHPGCRESG